MIKRKLTIADKNFYDAICNILVNGSKSEQARPVYKDGKQANSIYINGYYSSYDLSKNEFPITTLRPIAWKSAIKEILWIYQDSSNSLDVLRNKYGVNYWNDWEVQNEVANNGDLSSIGHRYGYTVRKHDYINRILKQLEENPWNRRNVISLWDTEDFDETDGLLPCAFLTMFDVRKVEDDIYLDCTLVQRSNDMLVAHHINAIQYVALQMMVACHFGWKVGKFNYLVNNLHIYDNQLSQTKEILDRYESIQDEHIEDASQELTAELLSKQLFGEKNALRINEDVGIVREFVNKKVGNSINSPTLKLNCPPKTNFYDIKITDFEMVNYNPLQPQIKFPDLAV